MRAAVADLAPSRRRGAAYGLFNTVYGVAWIVGSAAMGALYERRPSGLLLFTVVMEAAALVAFITLVRRRRLRA